MTAAHPRAKPHQPSSRPKRGVMDSTGTSTRTHPLTHAGRAERRQPSSRPKVDPIDPESRKGQRAGGRQKLCHQQSAMAAAPDVRAGADPKTLTVRVPLTIRKRGGRKLIIAPDGTCLPGSNATGSPLPRRIDSTIVKAIARAFRWRDLLEGGEYATIREIAHAETISESYVGRLLRLTLLAPDIVETILEGRQPAGLQLETLTQPLPVEWRVQRSVISQTV